MSSEASSFHFQFRGAKYIWQTIIQPLTEELPIPMNYFQYRAYFSHLLRAVPAKNATFEKQNASFSTENSKKHMPFRGV